MCGEVGAREMSMCELFLRVVYLFIGIGFLLFGPAFIYAALSKVGPQL